jgi:hypothetical protein
LVHHVLVTYLIKNIADPVGNLPDFNLTESSGRTGGRANTKPARNEG